MIILSTKRGDVHALAIEWALQCLGVETKVFYPGDIVKERVAYHVRTTRGRELPIKSSFETNNIDLIWFRKCPSQLRYPSSGDELNVFEQANYDETFSQYALDVQCLLGKIAPSINRPDIAFSASGKMVQLHAAQHVNFCMPKTIITSDAKEVMEFFNNKQDSIVFKPYRHNVWEVGRKEYSYSPARKIKIKEIREEELIPGIFQQFIDKRYEMRVCYFCGEIVSIKQSQKNIDAVNVDWRNHLSGEYSYEISKLPDELEKKCKTFMKYIDLEFGILDFVVDENGKFYFLELNPFGQFLYIDRLLPEAQVLKFCVERLLQRAGIRGVFAKADEINMQRFYKEYGELDFQPDGTGGTLQDIMSRQSLSLHNLQEEWEH